jgi:hypothetical protein
MHDPVQICTGRAASLLYEYGEAFFVADFSKATPHNSACWITEQGVPIR